MELPVEATVEIVTPQALRGDGQRRVEMVLHPVYGAGTQVGRAAHICHEEITAGPAPSQLHNLRPFPVDRGTDPADNVVEPLRRPRELYLKDGCSLDWMADSRVTAAVRHGDGHALEVSTLGKQKGLAEPLEVLFVKTFVVRRHPQEPSLVTSRHGRAQALTVPNYRAR
ncbi:hypothetical protein [Pseudofrankia inefficax]|uniref:hypothetical protein n=1 Tax=Pseudofrankia inefficax (strain DSM 45817 / CECT 9037 / DDB 130130 / EuI1c) TaxID=298654 RepID=UPI0012FD17B0|nr:hypothetical protein [Pseudofrankia inefficax]